MLSEKLMGYLPVVGSSRISVDWSVAYWNCVDDARMLLRKIKHCLTLLSSLHLAAFLAIVALAAALQ